MRRIKTRHDPFLVLFLITTMVCLLCCPVLSMGMSFGDDDEPTIVPVLEITPGPLSSPVGISLVFARQGLSSLLVTDAGKMTVNKIDPQNMGVVEELFIVEGLPLGIAEHNSHIYVGNRSTGSVDVYFSNSTRSRLVSRIETDEPMQPNDIAIDSGKYRLFVADGLANDVKVFTLSGRLVRTIDGFGDLFDPKSVAIHPLSESIAVTDSGDPKTGIPASVQIYDYSGSQLLRKTGGFSAPGGVALSIDRLFVADALLGQVLVFNRENGTLLGTFGSFGTDPKQLLFPIDLAFDETSELLYVVNNRMGNIVTYTPADFQAVEVTP